MRWKRRTYESLTYKGTCRHFTRKAVVFQRLINSIKWNAMKDSNTDRRWARFSYGPANRVFVWRCFYACVIHLAVRADWFQLQSTPRIQFNSDSSSPLHALKYRTAADAVCKRKAQSLEEEEVKLRLKACTGLTWWLPMRTQANRHRKPCKVVRCRDHVTAIVVRPRNRSGCRL
jgi:hypothetical protein